MNRFKELQFSLIRKFMIITILVSVVEYALMSILNHTLIPFVMHYFFDGQDFREIGVGGMLIALILLILALVFGVIINIIPDQLQYPINGIFTSLSTGAGNNLATGDNNLADMSLKNEAILTIIILGMVILILIPYAVAAFIYTRMVIREVNVLKAEDEKRQLEYEQKRNLLLSDIAHDLRTPMTTVSGYAQAIHDGMVDDERKQEYLDAIQTKSKRMNELITLLFDYVKLGSEGFKISKQKVDICELVREAAAFQYQDIEDAGMNLEVDIPEDIINIDADKLQISRVITNLITNAIRHNKKGTDIGLFLVYDEDIRILVADNGDPIPEEQAESLFEPFVMGDESRNSKGGTGLGLSIVKKILDMHGFRIRLVQEPEIRKYPLAADYSKMFMIIISE